VAKRTFLNLEQQAESQNILMPPVTSPTGELYSESPFATLDYSSWLGLVAESRFRHWDGWKESSPIALGSWARGELCPNSDLDVVFCGEASAVEAISQRAAEEGLPLRYRMPQNPDDWSEAVEIFDTNALLWAKPFVPKASEKLMGQKELIFKKKKTFRKNLLKAIIKERKRRRERYDSIANFLEPNVKYGPGGLRDILQAEILRFWFPERFQNENHSFRLFSYFRKFFLIIRQKLHLQVGLDVLIASEQADMARWFGSPSTLDFMGEVQKGLSRVNFYSDWVVAQCSLGKGEWELEKERSLTQRPCKWPQVFDLLENQPGVFSEFIIRRSLNGNKGLRNSSTLYRSLINETMEGPGSVSDSASVSDREGLTLSNSSSDTFSGSATGDTLGPPSVGLNVSSRKRVSLSFPQELKPSIGKALRGALNVKNSEDQIRGLFNGQVLLYLFPEFKKIVGRVQHDQYHRYSVDAHLLQALRGVQKAFRNPRSFGRLAKSIEGLGPQDWEILMWAALYHDMGKGRTGDHEEIGAAFVRKDFAKMGFPKKLTEEVAWIVEQHLILSQAAFRKNIQNPKVWRSLHDLGVTGKRVDRLTIFTAVDIRATNPQAWTSWKEYLLFELAETLKSPSMAKKVQMTLALEKKNRDREVQFLEALDGVLIESLPKKILLKDIHEFIEGEALEPLIHRDEQGYLWVRFSEKEDSPGLFYEYASRLNYCSCQIRYAAILSDKEKGVYDWFQVKTNASIKSLTLQLKSSLKVSSPKRVIFDQVDLVQEDKEEWVFSFKAKDAPGLLLNVAKVLMDLQLDIAWARVLTWGRQIDDVFAVMPLHEISATDLLETLKSQLLANTDQK